MSNDNEEKNNGVKEKKDEKDSKEKKRVVRTLKEAVRLLEAEQSFASLIPEIRTNIAMALPAATSVKDVAAVDGRITVVGGKPKAAGPIKFGVSKHMAHALLARMRFDTTKRAAINLRLDERILRVTEEIAQEKQIGIASFDRADEPHGDVEGRTLSWGVQRALERAVKNNSTLPGIIWDKGDVGKEPVIRIFGTDAVAVAKVAIEIGRRLGKE
jgi:hydroxymethylpyrimidine/phosphomethylpyrimidine kinase